MADIDSCSIKGQLFERRQLEEIKNKRPNINLFYT